MKPSGIVIATIALLASAQVSAWDGVVTGRIQSTDVTDGPAYALRIELQGSPTLCGSAQTWAFVDSTTANYNAYVATILAAKAASELVVVYTTRDASTGYCRIGYIKTYAS